MTEDVIEYYDTFNTKGCLNKITSGEFNDQPIPYNYYNLLNDEYGDGNNIPDTPVDNSLLENEGVEDAVMPNYGDINNEITIDENDSLASGIEPPPPKRNSRN